MADSGNSTLFMVFLIIIVLIMFALIIYNLYYSRKKHHDMVNVTNEIKSKIGSLIREFNINSRQDYNINVAQQNEIDLLKEKVT
jgi:hypothetical protein